MKEASSPHQCVAEAFLVTIGAATVGTALTLQLAGGFALTVATIRVIPFLEDAFGWRWAFAFLAPGQPSAWWR